MQEKDNKVWGTTHCLFDGASTQVYYLEAKKGGYSSRHHHLTKYNKFFVVSGSLKIIVFREKELTPEETILVEGQSVDVPPLLDHKFEALEDTRAIEVYWGDQLQKEDIVRKDEGGCFLL